jgi:hypothetical protein
MKNKKQDNHNDDYDNDNHKDDEISIDLKQAYKGFPKHAIWGMLYFFMLILLINFPDKINEVLYREKWEAYQNQTSDTVIVDIMEFNDSDFLSPTFIESSGSCVKYYKQSGMYKPSFLCMREMGIEYINKAITKSAIIFLFILLFVVPIVEHIGELPRNKDNAMMQGFMMNIQPMIRFIIIFQCLYIIVMQYLAP